MSKFCLVVPEEFKTHYNQHPFEITGLLNWAKVLNGDVKVITEDHSNYDWIMTNVSSTESEYISYLRQEVPDAKIIACFDYGFSAVNQYFLSLQRVKQVMERADVVFSVNRNQQEWMKLILPDKDIHYIPHPSDTQNILKFRKKPEDRTEGVCAMWHEYDNYTVQMFEVLKAVERKLGKPLRKTLIGLKSRKMQEKGMRVLASNIPIVSNDYPEVALRGQPLDPEIGKVIERSPPGVGWDVAFPYMGVEGWYDTLSRYRAALDLYTVDSVGRFAIDCAGVGLPCIASTKQDSSKLLFPFTTVDPFIPTAAVQFMTKLLRDETFYLRVENTALKNVKHYGFEKSRERIMTVLEEVA